MDLNNMDDEQVYKFIFDEVMDNNFLEVIGLSVYHSKRDLDGFIPKLKKRIS